MLTLRGNVVPSTSSLDRRSFLTLGALPPLGLSLPGLLTAGEQSVAPTQKDVSIILFFMAGGPSHIDMYDMKPDQPAEIRGPFAPIETSLPGLSVCDLMPRHAAIADRLSVIRSISHDLSVVKFMSDRMIVMNQGVIEELGYADDIYSFPKKEYTKKLILAIPKGRLQDIKAAQDRRGEKARETAPTA